MLDRIHGWISAADAFVWGPPLLIVLFGTHIFLTIRTAFMQRYLFTAIKLSVTPEKGAAGDVSPFGALTTALAATIGTGNIVGVATAVSLGRPGRGALDVAHRRPRHGHQVQRSAAGREVPRQDRGRDDAGWTDVRARERPRHEVAGRAFALFTVFASFGIGNMVQANSISTLAASTFGVNVHVTGVVLAVLTAVVVLGGLQSIARVCEWLVPFMAIVYIGGCLHHPGQRTAISCCPAIELIVTSAFSRPRPLAVSPAPTVLAAARYGVARGLFSNESGLGSAPIVAAAAQSRNPVRQALVSATGTFWDTVVICLLSGLVDRDEHPRAAVARGPARLGADGGRVS